jgi:protein-disulfide isomerase
MSSPLTMAVNAERDHIRGPMSAPITLVEYGDYQCPYCAQADEILRKVLPQVNGRVRFVFRNFPLTEMHPQAGHAAEAAEAAGAAGKFWEMHDTLYEHQRSLGDTALRTLAEGVGVDGEMIVAALEEGTFEEHVSEDFMSGVRSGVNGTPTFFINGVRHDAGWDEETLLRTLQGPA